MSVSLFKLKEKNPKCLKLENNNSHILNKLFFEPFSASQTLNTTSLHNWGNQEYSLLQKIHVNFDRF